MIIIINVLYNVIVYNVGRILGGSIRTLKENAEALVADTRDWTGSKC